MACLQKHMVRTFNPINKWNEQMVQVKFEHLYFPQKILILL